MITGFNTDIEYQGVIYHVQTEDKGVNTPLILSLVYDRGTILASKRSPYDDLLVGTFDENVLAERLQKQHKLICAAITAGRIEDLKRMTQKESEASKQRKLIVQKEVRPPVQEAPPPVEQPVAPPIQQQPVAPPQPQAPPVNIPPSQPPQVQQPMRPQEQIHATNPDPLPPPQAAPRPPNQPEPPPISRPRQELDFGYTSINITEDDLIIDGAEIVEEELILPAEAVAIVSEYAAAGQKGSGKLSIDLLSETEFKGGERKTLGILIYRGHTANVVENAQIMLKVLGSSFRPLIFHAKTDEKGVATVHLQLPHFRAGRAALMVRVMSDGEESEIRRRVLHG